MRPGGADISEGGSTRAGWARPSAEGHTEEVPLPPRVSLEGPGPESGLLMAAIGAEGAADTGLGGVGQCADGHECGVRGKGGLWQVPWPWGPEPWEGMEQEPSLTLGPSLPLSCQTSCSFAEGGGGAAGAGRRLRCWGW